MSSTNSMGAHDGAAAHIEPRRFDRPQRLSAAELADLQGKLRKALPDAANELAVLLRAAPSMTVVEVREVDVEGLELTLTPALAALRFEIAGQPGWLTWDCSAALGAIETALGATVAAKHEPRALSSIERAMLLRSLAGPVTTLARALGLEAGRFVYAPDADVFGTWRRGGERAEPRRLLVTLEFAGPDSVSTWSLYFPGVAAPTKPAAANAAAHLPDNLEDVAIEVIARLGSGEVTLSDLLALEIGDVIPLQHAVGEPLLIVVEDHACLRGTLGRAQGKLGVRITGVHTQTTAS